MWWYARLLPSSVTFILTLGHNQANLLGSSIGLYSAYHIERYYRHRREVRLVDPTLSNPALSIRNLQISRLYRPLDAEYDEDSDEEDEGADGERHGAGPILPMHYPPSASRGASPKPPRPAAGAAKPGPPGPGGRKVQAGGAGRLSNVWDEREELFDIGEESGSEDEEGQAPHRAQGRAPAPVPDGPQIVITPSS
jgi:hypothetical protein